MTDSLPDLMPAVAPLPDEVASLRALVRAFVAEQIGRGAWQPQIDGWLSGWNPQFSKELAARGWVGMAIPKEYGGHGSSALARYVVIEELLAAGAPVAAHWMADRQIAPALQRHGSAAQRAEFLPKIAAGEFFAAVALSEPDTGSDLASVRTRAIPSTGGWWLTGTKIWTSGAHGADAIFVLARSAPADADNRHAGLSQFIVDPQAPGVQVRPIPILTGSLDFNEIVLNDVFVPAERLLGEPGQGWHQVTSELAYERSGPERFLSTFPLLVALVGELAAGPTDPTAAAAVGSLITRLWTLRQMSISVAAALDAGEAPALAAALVKDVGTRFESTIAEAARQLCARPGQGGEFARLLADAVLHSPAFTLRGGTNEVLRGIVARGLGLR
jgi:alkylation response protein AidB-like acyl-CoA dehydrogenase